MVYGEQVLGDEEQRARYNQFGHAGVDGSAGTGGFQGAHPGFDPREMFKDFEHMFGGGFGGFGGRQNARRGGGPVPTHGEHVQV